jgi:hypothetical protein
MRRLPGRQFARGLRRRVAATMPRCKNSSFWMHTSRLSYNAAL